MAETATPNENSSGVNPLATPVFGKPANFVPEEALEASEINAPEAGESPVTTPEAGIGTNGQGRIATFTSSTPDGSNITAGPSQSIEGVITDRINSPRPVGGEIKDSQNAILVKSLRVQVELLSNKINELTVAIGKAQMAGKEAVLKETSGLVGQMETLRSLVADKVAEIESLKTLNAKGREKVEVLLEKVRVLEASILEADHLLSTQANPFMGAGAAPNDAEPRLEAVRPQGIDEESVYALIKRLRRFSVSVRWSARQLDHMMKNHLGLPRDVVTSTTVEGVVSGNDDGAVTISTGAVGSAPLGGTFTGADRPSAAGKSDGAISDEATREPSKGATVEDAEALETPQELATQAEVQDVPKVPAVSSAGEEQSPVVKPFDASKAIIIVEALGLKQDVEGSLESPLKRGPDTDILILSDKTKSWLEAGAVK